MYHSERLRFIECVIRCYWGSLGGGGGGGSLGGIGLFRYTQTLLYYKRKHRLRIIFSTILRNLYIIFHKLIERINAKVTLYRYFLHFCRRGRWSEKSVSLTLAVGKWIYVASLILNRYGNSSFCSEAVVEWTDEFREHIIN